MKIATLKLTLNVDYDLSESDIDVSELESMMRKMVLNAIGEGMLTGHTDAVVDEYAMNIEVIQAPEEGKSAVV